MARNLVQKGFDDVLVVLGGIISDADASKLQAIGIKGVFLSGTAMRDIVEFIAKNVRPRLEKV